MPKRKVKQRERQVRPTSCVVCGNFAAGFNYDAPSCASCKAFFRRVVIKQQVFAVCDRMGLCANDVRRCRPCRYDKCIRGGMNPLIVTCPEQGKHLKSIDSSSSTSETEPSTSGTNSDCSPRENILRNDSEMRQTDVFITDYKSRLQLCEATSRESEDIPSDPIIKDYDDPGNEMPILRNPLRIENKLELMMRNLLVLNEGHQKLRVSTYTTRLVPGLSIDDFAFVPSKLGTFFKPMEFDYEPVSIMLIPVQLIINHRLITDHTKFDHSTRKLWPVQDVVYSIEFIKAMPFYNLLDDCSKKSLIGSALICSNFTTAFFSFVNQSDRTIYPDGSLMTWSREVQEQSPESTCFHTRLIAAMREAQLDTREFVLLKTIIVCNPLLDGLRAYDAAVLQQMKERCTKALLSYVLARRGVDKGPAYFANLLSIIDLATKLTSWQKSTHILGLAMGLYKNVTPFAETIFHSQ